MICSTQGTSGRGLLGHRQWVPTMAQVWLWRERVIMRVYNHFIISRIYNIVKNKGSEGAAINDDT